MKKDFCPRLNRCLSRGDFTVADLSHWFGRPYHTVWFWVHKDREPRGSAGQRKLMLRRLELLEKTIITRRFLPVPVDLNQFERPDYIEKLRNDLEAPRVSQGHSTR